MEMSNYTINYRAYYKNGWYDDGKSIELDCESESEAKIRLENRLYKKSKNLDRVIIDRCEKNKYNIIWK